MREERIGLHRGDSVRNRRLGDVCQVGFFRPLRLHLVELDNCHPGRRLHGSDMADLLGDTSPIVWAVALHPRSSRRDADHVPLGAACVDPLQHRSTPRRTINMTLIMTVNRPDTIWMMADRQVIAASATVKTRRKSRRHSLKLLPQLQPHLQPAARRLKRDHHGIRQIGRSTPVGRLVDQDLADRVD